MLVQVWLIDLDLCAESLARAWQEIAGRVQDRAADSTVLGSMLTGLRSVSDVEQRRRAVCHAALRLILLRRAGPADALAEFARSPQGRPSVPGSAIDFSISHCRGVALVALVDGGRIGVDIETQRQVRVSTSRRERLEQAAQVLLGAGPLSAGDADRRFLQAWVRIEAYAKYMGHGVGTVLEWIGRPTDAALAGRPAIPSQSVVVDLAFDAQPKHLAALASDGPQPVIEKCVLPAELGQLLELARPALSVRRSKTSARGGAFHHGIGCLRSPDDVPRTSSPVARGLARQQPSLRSNRVLPHSALGYTCS